MRIILLLVASLYFVLGCQKSDPVEPALTTVDGAWTYTTPDNSIKVDFEFKDSDAGLTVLNPKITVNKVPGEAFAQLTSVDLPAIEILRINANDVVLVQPYSITFNDCTVAPDFKRILVTEAIYTYPWGTMKTLSGIYIDRKP